MPENKISFEEAYQKLEEISQKIENDTLSLEESLELFEEGLKLSGYCSKILKNAKQKIDTITAENGDKEW